MVTRPARIAPAEASATLLGQAQAKGYALADALGLSDRRDAIASALAGLLGVHGPRSLALPPAWGSDICDDHGPYEYSVSLNAQGAALRVLVETGAADPDATAMQSAAEAATAGLAARYGASLDRLRRVEDLFVGDGRPAQFARWHAVDFAPGGPAAKVYLNPQIAGPDGAAPRVKEALLRLGLGSAWHRLQQALGRGELDELKYVGLDLCAERGARVKVYVRHHGIDAPALEQVLRGCAGYEHAQATEFCRRMTGSSGPFDTKPIITCFSWSEGQPECAATLHVPIRGYVRDDGVALDRILAFLRTAGIPERGYEAALRAFAGRRLHTGVGIQSYASLKPCAHGSNVTVYLVPETYAVRRPNEGAPAIVADRSAGGQRP